MKSRPEPLQMQDASPEVTRPAARFADCSIEAEQLDALSPSAKDISRKLREKTFRGLFNKYPNQTN